MKVNARQGRDRLKGTIVEDAASPRAISDDAGTADADGGPKGGLDRRTFVKRAAATAGGVALLGSLPGIPAGTASAAAAAKSASGPLKPSEMKTLEAVLECVIPTDELGPGAVEVGVPAYIQGGLAGSYKPLVAGYQTFLSALDQSAKSTGKRSFAALSEMERIKLLEAVEAGKAPGVPAALKGAAAELFQLVLEHTREGMFGDPMYGGNKNLEGWKLIGYPGIQLVVSKRLQEIDTKVPRTEMTAASYGGKPYNGVPM
jgi:gluconate 2-dehydrogenase gamma chain